MKAYEHTLDNGLTAIAVPMEDNPTVTAMVMVNAGTRFENKENNGISHFLEHMCFKGTENRPSSAAVSEELDGLGAKSNAFTWYEYTGYFAKSQPANTREIFDVIADIYLNSLFPKEEIEKEKGVIIEEINMYEDLPMQKVQQLFRETVYQDQPAGWDVLGSKENVTNMTQKDFRHYHDTHYQPQNTAVVIAGGVSKNTAFELAEDYFADITTGDENDQPAVTTNQSSPRAAFEQKDSDQSHITVGFRSVDIHDDMYYPLEVAGTVLARGMSSRLFQKLRDDMGVCYYVTNQNGYYSDTGLFKISTGVDNQRVTETTTVIMDELQKIKDKKVDDAELDKAKEYLAGNKLMEYESSDSLARYYGNLFVTDRPLESPQQLVDTYRQVTADDIQQACQHICTPDRLNFALVGPEQDESDIEDILTIH
jgi:predicted Zn-dependent peptidase